MLVSSRLITAATTTFSSRSMPYSRCDIDHFDPYYDLVNLDNEKLEHDALKLALHGLLRLDYTPVSTIREVKYQLLALTQDRDTSRAQDHSQHAPNHDSSTTTTLSTTVHSEKKKDTTLLLKDNMNGYSSCNPATHLVTFYTGDCVRHSPSSHATSSLKLHKASKSKQKEMWQLGYLWPVARGPKDFAFDLVHIRPVTRAMSLQARQKRSFNPFFSSDFSVASLQINHAEEIRGEIARALLYLDTMFGYSTRGVGVVLVNDAHTMPESASTHRPHFLGYLSTLLEWHENYPAADHELRRNSAICHIQGNRNPYVDYPDLVNRVYGSAGDASVSSPLSTRTIIEFKKKIKDFAKGDATSEEEEPARRRAFALKMSAWLLDPTCHLKSSRRVAVSTHVNRKKTKNHSRFQKQSKAFSKHPQYDATGRLTRHPLIAARCHLHGSRQCVPLADCRYVEKTNSCESTLKVKQLMTHSSVKKKTVTTQMQRVHVPMTTSLWMIKTTPAPDIKSLDTTTRNVTMRQSPINLFHRLATAAMGNVFSVLDEEDEDSYEDTSSSSSDESYDYTMILEQN